MKRIQPDLAKISSRASLAGPFGSGLFCHSVRVLWAAAAAFGRLELFSTRFHWCSWAGIAAVLCIILGMGMPTGAVYILLAIPIAPSLVDVGVSPIAAHMFTLYLGMMSLITPPVAVAAYFAASIAGSSPMATGWTSMRFGWTAYVVPFLFVFSPRLLLQGDSVWTLVVAVASAVGRVWLVSAGMMGYFTRHMDWLTRAGFVVAGVLMLIPYETADWASYTDLTCIVAGIALAAREYVTGRRSALATARCLCGDGAAILPAGSGRRPAHQQWRAWAWCAD